MGNDVKVRRGFRLVEGLPSDARIIRMAQFQGVVFVITENWTFRCVQGEGGKFSPVPLAKPPAPVGLIIKGPRGTV